MPLTAQGRDGSRTLMCSCQGADIQRGATQDAGGVPRDVRSTVTDPPSFGRHANAAVTAWVFEPATRDGQAVAAQCAFEFTYSYG